MSAFDYKVLPAPRRGLKARGVKSTEERFAHALEQEMNRLGAEGWEYLRADTLPCDERSGLTGRTTTFQSVLVFRRARPAASHAPVIAAPVIAAPAPMAIAAPEPDVVAVPIPETSAERQADVRPDAAKPKAARSAKAAAG